MFNFQSDILYTILYLQQFVSFYKKYIKYRFFNILYTILLHQMEANMIKQALKELPTQERVVAIALKNIYDRIKQLNREQQKEIDANHLSFISKFKVLQKKASNIIEGCLLKEEDLDTTDQFFDESEQKQKKEQMSKKQKIEDFWLNCLVNSMYGEDLSDFDKQILRHITNIETNITTDTLQFTLTFEENPYIQKTKLTKRLVLDNGIPAKYQGDEPKWINQKSTQGIFCQYIFGNTTQQNKLLPVMDIVGNLINQIIPYNLQYFLGIIQHGQVMEQGDQEEEDQEQKQN